MKKLEISKAFMLMESGPVVLVTTNDGKKNNIMTISWTMVLDFTPVICHNHWRLELFLCCSSENKGVCYFNSHG